HRAHGATGGRRAPGPADGGAAHGGHRGAGPGGGARHARVPRPRGRRAGRVRLRVGCRRRHGRVPRDRRHRPGARPRPRRGRGAPPAGHRDVRRAAGRRRATRREPRSDRQRV
ncbi:MAG: hypothetical protein AVDCRST_MAG11-2412, partial [uncultured Gemmatimonadaceae bacterium]